MLVTRYTLQESSSSVTFVISHMFLSLPPYTHTHMYILGRCTGAGWSQPDGTLRTCGTGWLPWSCNWGTLTPLVTSFARYRRVLVVMEGRKKQRFLCYLCTLKPCFSVVTFEVCIYFALILVFFNLLFSHNFHSSTRASTGSRMALSPPQPPPPQLCKPQRGRRPMIMPGSTNRRRVRWWTTTTMPGGRQGS